MFSQPDYTNPALGLPLPANTFTFSQVRISVLTPRCIRLEISPNGQFADAPSQQFLFRAQTEVPLDVVQNENEFHLSTEFFELHYKQTDRLPSPRNFSVSVKETGSIYHYSDANRQNLPGTNRTLDRTNGRVSLSQGLISRSGWTMIDDTRSLLFTPQGWLAPRPQQKGYQDLYLLISGHDYKAALDDYQMLAGRGMLLPRFMLGNWWSRYWAYSDADIHALVGRFEEEQIPLSVFIIDMDWHITQTGNRCSGWTGFSWNRELFPDPKGLLAWLHDHHLRTALNLHPAEGVHPHEERYAEMARRMGIDPASEKPVVFDITDPDFAAAYFDVLLRPREKEGVDFWWIDWQQGHLTRIPSLDPLWWLNHLHYQDLGRDESKRPVVFSRWGGPGSHRYPIGFSGDTVISWKSLALQPFFTSSAANVAYGWWSHDIGGHMFGKENAELYTRWVQFGLLSPILRLHSTKDKHLHHLPWGFDANTLTAVREAMQLRNALTPYLYSMAHRFEKSGLPLCTPLYYDWPEEEAAYQARNQYLFGDQLMTAPVTRPIGRGKSAARHRVWFPAGEWIDFFSGERFHGPDWKMLSVPIDRIPFFARAGAIVPLRAPLSPEDGSNPAELELYLFPGEKGSFTLYEDDNTSQKYRQGQFCTTLIEQQRSGSALEVTIHASEGALALLPDQRSYTLHLRGVKAVGKVSAKVAGTDRVLKVQSENSRELVLEAVSIRPREEIRFAIEGVEKNQKTNP